MRRILSYYLLGSPWTMVYMLQQVEYDPRRFLFWVNSFPNLRRVKRRGELVLTTRIKLMIFVGYFSWLLALVMPAIVVMLTGNLLWLSLLVFVPVSPVVWLCLATFLLQKLVVNPSQNREIVLAREKLDAMNAVRIAVLGSYGKTTMKEILRTVLSEGRKVAATPGNKNVLISHARWINKEVAGDEDVLIFEYGESQPGDIAALAGFSRPTHAFVTGVAPAHLDHYPSLQSVAEDLASIKNFMPRQQVYVNAQAEPLRSLLEGNYYSNQGLKGHKVSNVSVDFSGTSFTLTHETKTLKFKTGLLGEHQIGPVCAAIAVAKGLGLNDEQIIRGVAATSPYEHRMQPRQLHGAWIIDDTYNGNIEGIRVGLNLLRTLPGRKKIYITPGLVDQGVETQSIHEEIGHLIAEARPDKVVLMNNSVTTYIQAGLTEAKYTGKLVIESDPLQYYSSLEHLVAAGDVVMLQNDWPDSYRQ